MPDRRMIFVQVDDEGNEWMLYQDHETILDDVYSQIADLYCPNANGFEGPDTFPDCGECIVCKAKEKVNNDS